MGADAVAVTVIPLINGINEMTWADPRNVTSVAVVDPVTDDDTRRLPPENAKMRFDSEMPACRFDRRAAAVAAPSFTAADTIWRA
jgi:hypothetical protein